MKASLLSILLIFLTGCAGSTTSPTYPIDEETQIGWPSAPDRTRIRYLYSFANYKDLGMKLPASHRFRKLLAGEDLQNMIRPYAVAVDDKLLAVADPSAGIVHLFNTYKNRYRKLSNFGGVQFNSPIAVSLAENRIFVADSALNEIYIYNRDLDNIAKISNLDRPTAMAWDPATQRLFVSETLSHRLQVYDADGSHLLDIGKRGFGPAEFNFPTHIAIRNGLVFVNDTMNFRIQILDTSGNHIRTFGEHGDEAGYLSHPKGVAIDSQNNVYVAEAVMNRIQIFNMDGQFLMDFGEGGDSPGSFMMPAGLTIFGDRLYVCDSRNSRIQVFEYLKEE